MRNARKMNNEFKIYSIQCHLNKACVNFWYEKCFVVILQEPLPTRSIVLIEVRTDDIL